jgi:hypothetical protein
VVSAPLQLVFGVHLHQPVGNFDHVFAEHTAQVYRPLLAALAERQLGPVGLHVSGPLLEWLQQHDPAVIAQMAELTASGRLDPWCAGMYEPILATLSPVDRVEQISWHRAMLKDLLGADATGLWLTERVWEPDLPQALAAAGVRYVLVDDRHFLVAGIERAQLDRPWRTEHSGAHVDVLPIDERLRYLIPFRPWHEIEAFLRAERAAGRRLLVFADDGEKFGGWPGTAQWVWADGWMRSFLDGLEALTAEGVVQLVRGVDAIAELPRGGLCYLPTASYREMELWALPPAAAERLTALEQELGEDRLRGADGALVRGTHWRSFLAKYPEANRLHKLTQRLSALSRARGDPPAARRAIARAQCNDALWHGVFGGLYLPFLRSALWAQVALAERVLRTGEALTWEAADVDADGALEIYVHSATISALVALGRGGAVEVCTLLERGLNVADTLTRRVEAYHAAAVAASHDVASHAAHAAHDGAPSIHDLERALVLERVPPHDAAPRGIGVERFIGPDVTDDSWRVGVGLPTPIYGDQVPPWTVLSTPDAVTVRVLLAQVRKEITLAGDGGITLRYTWDPAVHDPATRFAVECSVAVAVTLQAPGARVWAYPIETVAKSERGLDRTHQGVAHVVEWPVGAGVGELVLRA